MSPQLADLFEAVLCHWRKAAAFSAVVLLLTWVAIVVWPRSYLSESLLLVRVGRESVALDPTATVGQTLMLQKTQEDEVNSALNILGSHQVAAEAVDAIGPAKVLGYEPLETPSGAAGEAGWLDRSIGAVRDALDGALWAARLKDPVSDRELAVNRLLGCMSVYSSKGSMVIVVRATAKSPQLAQRMVSEVCDAFQARRIASSSTAGSRDFFDNEVSQLGQQLEAKIEALGQFRRDHKIISIEANRQVLRDQIARVERDLSIATGGLKQARAEVDSLRTKVAEVAPEIIKAQTAASDTTWSGMRQSLYALQLEEKKLSQVVTASHPRLVAIREQVKQAEAILAGQAQEAVDKTTAPNPLRQDLVERLVTGETTLAGLESRVDSLQRQRDESHAELTRLVENEVTLTRMERDIEMLEADFRRLQLKQQEARVIEGLEDEKFSNVSVVQPATLNERPVSPKKKILALLGALASVAGGLSLALVAEATRGTLRTTEHTESQLRLPVLVTIPESDAGRGGRQGELDSLRHGPDGSTPEDPRIRAACRSLLRQLFTMGERGTAPRTVGVLSCCPGAGGSTVASILAVIAADEFSLDTVLVDADDRDRFVSRAFQLNGKPGMRELVRGGTDTEACLQPCLYPKLKLMASASPQSAGEQYSDPRAVLAELNQLGGRHELILVDLPPATAPNDGSALASMLDCVVLVVESESTSARAAVRVRERLERTHARVEGVVLNKTKSRLPSWN